MPNRAGSTTYKSYIIKYVLFLFFLVVFAKYSIVGFEYYQFWKIHGYLSQGTIALDNSTLLAPSSLTQTEKENYCRKMRVLDVSSGTSPAVVFYAPNLVYCGCTPPKNSLSYSVKYKLFKDKIIYQCDNLLVETSNIPPQLLNIPSR